MSIHPLRDFRPTDVWYTVCPVPSAASVALGRDEIQARFADMAVNLRNVRIHSDRNVRESHYDQTQQNLFREGGKIPPLWSRSEGRDVRVIGLSWVEHYAAIIALSGSNIRTPADLKDKRLGLINRPNDRIDFNRATQLRGYLVALKAGGVSRNGVTFVSLTYDKPLVALLPEKHALSSSTFGIIGVRERQSALIKALPEGSIDALYLMGPDVEVQYLTAANLIYDAAKSLDPKGRVSNLTPMTFTVKGELLDSQPDIVTEYIDANLSSAKWAREIPREAVQLSYSPKVFQQLETSIDEDLIDHLHAKGFSSRRKVSQDRLQFRRLYRSKPPCSSAEAVCRGVSQR